MDSAAARLLALLQERGASLATAESLTGGQLAARLTSVPGASRVFRGGVVSYATEVKRDVLGVPAEVVDRHGVISPECAVAMAEGARALVVATYALSTTGVAGPDPQEGWAPGTVFIGVAGPARAWAIPLSLTGDRAAIQAATCGAAVDALTAALREEEPALG